MPWFIIDVILIFFQRWRGTWIWCLTCPCRRISSGIAPLFPPSSSSAPSAGLSLLWLWHSSVSTVSLDLTKLRHLNTVKKAKKIIVCIVIFSLIFNLPQWFIMSYQGRVCTNYAKMYLTSVRVYFFMAFAVHFALPFVSLLGMNSVIIHVLRKRSLTMTVRSEGQGQDQSGGKMRSAERQIYIMLLLVAFAFLLLHTPGYILVFYTNFGNYNQSPKAFAGYYLFYIVGSHLLYTNYGINFFLYVISGQKFRSDLLRLFNCKKKTLHRGSSFVVTSVSTVQTSEPELSKPWRKYCHLPDSNLGAKNIFRVFFLPSFKILYFVR